MRLLSIIYKFYTFHFTMIHNGLVAAKLKSSAIIGLTVSPVVFMFEFISNWSFDNRLYLSVVIISLILDWLIGIVAHLFYFKDFSSRKMTIKFLEKLFCTYVGLVLFELFGILFMQYELEMWSYLKLSMSLTVLSYPTLSAFGNLSVITKGKFPPIGWINKLNKFSDSADLRDIIDKNEHTDDYR